MRLLKVENVRFHYDGVEILKGICFAVHAGSFTGIAGPNGAGKTTLLRVIQRLRTPSRGDILIHDRSLKSLSAKEAARCIASVWERPQTSFHFTARQFVALGRTPYLNFFKQEGREDIDIVQRVMQQTDCLQFELRPVSQLSGGEFQRVCIAAALAQQPQILLLDEPTNFLDLKQQFRLSHLLSNLQEQGITILCASHDLAFLRRHCSNVLLLKDGKQAGFGEPADMLSEKNLYGLFELEEELHCGLRGRPFTST